MKYFDCAFNIQTTKISLFITKDLSRGC